MNISKTVHETFLECLYEVHEIKISELPLPQNAVIVEGVVGKYAFNPDRLIENKEKIRQLLNEMPGTFHWDRGGGWSFLNLCFDKNDSQWGEHPTMNELYCLGNAVGMASFVMPREIWSALPGGMPYIVFDTRSL